ncbi:MAG: tRNA lysidine(34) synthetase TilS, partial [Chloroflexota bacterium]
RSASLLRNRVRSELLPLLRSFNSNIDTALLRTSRLASDDYSFVAEHALRIWSSVARCEEDAVVLDAASVSSLHPSVQRHLLRSALHRLLGNLRDIEVVHIEDMVRMLKKPVGSTLSLPHQLVFSVGYGTCTVGRLQHCGRASPVLEGEYRLAIPGETVLPGWRVVAEMKDRVPANFAGERFWACFDLSVVGNELVVRGRRPGDSFQPLGMAQHKKLQDFMVDAKVPRLERDSVPLVCSPKNIIWVVGWRVDERARLSTESGPFVCLEFRRTSAGDGIETRRSE